MITLIIGTLAVAILTFSVLWPTVDQSNLTVWFAAMLISLLLRTMSILQYRRQDLTVSNAKQWLDKATFWSTISGVLWGLVFVFFTVPEEFLYIVFVVGVYCGFLSSSVSSMAIHIPTYLAFSVPSSMLFLIKCIANGMNGYGIIFYLTAIVIVVFFTVMTSFARNTQESFNKTTRLTYENNKLLGELVEQKEKAEKAVLAKDQFLAAASHDLRQPLHALGLFVSALNDFPLEEEARRCSEKIKQSAFALNGLLNGLLDISRLDAAAVECRPNHIFLKPIIESIELEYLQIVKEQGTAINIDISDQLVIYADEMLLQRVIRNLVDNAVKFTSDGVISISGVPTAKNGHESESIHLIIEDTGIGIPEDLHQDVFSEFTQLNNPERDRKKGLGLGLAIVKRLCLLMDIKIEMDSEFQVGTRFSLALPKGDVAIALKNFEEYAMNQEKDIALNGESSRLANKVIVVIDDEIDILTGMGRLLTKRAAKMILAINGDDAIIQLNEKDYIPDLLIVDFRLRDNLNGVEVINQLRDEYNIDIPAILISGDTSPDRLNLAKTANIQMLHKPVPPNILNDVISEICV